MNLKELRKSSGLTQPEAADLVGVPFRTYCRYEDEPNYVGTFKHNQFMKLLEDYAKNRVLTVEAIKEAVGDVCTRYPIDACYLFGSYAKGKATKDSDVDLMIVSSIEGIEYYDLLGSLEERLSKKVDLLRLETAIQNVKLMNEILKEGIRVYG